MPGKRLTKIEEQEIIKQYKNDINCDKIAIAVKRSPRTIHEVLNRNHITKDRRNAHGKKHRAWKGGKVKHSEGYVCVLLPLTHPFSNMAEKSGYVREHRLVMAENLGRPLCSDEQVHHINGIKTDNRLENLQLVFTAHGNGIVLECQHCGSRNILPVEKNEARKKGINDSYKISN